MEFQAPVCMRTLGIQCAQSQPPVFMQPAECIQKHRHSSAINSYQREKESHRRQLECNVPYNRVLCIPLLLLMRHGRISVVFLHVTAAHHWIGLSRYYGKTQSFKLLVLSACTTTAAVCYTRQQAFWCAESTGARSAITAASWAVSLRTRPQINRPRWICGAACFDAS